MKSSLLLCISLVSLAACGLGGTPGCSCDGADPGGNACIELSAPAVYAIQLETSCVTLEGTCSAAGLYSDDACPTGDIVATCVIDNFSYTQTKYYYAPIVSGDAEVVEDCDPGTLTWL
jgi:hypothetical protein